MNCNKETSTSDNGYIIRHVYGNVLRVAIPLTLRTIEKVNDEIVATDTDFIPSSDYPVTIEFKKDAVKVNFDAVMQNGNVAYIEDTGTIPVGTYDITVLCKDDEGKPYRFKQKTVLRVYDYTKDAGIEESIEFEAEVWYLDAAIYLALKGDKGDTGVGIQDIVISDSDESLGVNMITIILDNGNEYTFTVLNGIYDPQGYTHTDNNYTNQDKQIVSNVTNRINTLNRSAVGNVTYDELNKVLRGMPVDDGGEGTVIFQIDMTPFINDNYVEDAYLENGILTIDFNSESNRQPITIDLRDWINASNYYTKQQSDAKYMTKEESEDFVKYNAADKINYSAMPFVLLSSLNFAYNGNPTASLIGNAYYCTDGYVRYFYRKDNRINNIYSVPIPGVLYCLKTTGDIYRWDASNREFVLTNNNVNLSNYYTKSQTDVLINGLMGESDYVFQGRIRFDKSARIVLDFINLPAAPGEDEMTHELLGGEFYGDTNGHIYYNPVDYVGTSDVVDFGIHSDVAFVNAEDNKFYRWTGSTWQVVSGGSGSGGYEPPVGGIPKSDLSQSVQDTLDDVSNKVDKVNGKGLSTNDYTTAEKEKLAGLSAQVQADWEESDTSNPAYIQHKPTIPTAINGKSAYQIAVDNGFVGTEAQWLESLHGADGQDGKDGVDGKDGADGKDGTNGINGQDGADGQDGQDGQDGKSAYQSYIDTTSDDPVKTEAQWVASLKGEQGNNGFSVNETSTAIVFTVWQGATIEETSTKITITA